MLFFGLKVLLSLAPSIEGGPVTTFLSEALEAVMEGRPDQPIKLADGDPPTFVRAAWLVHALSPEALARAEAHIASERGSDDPPRVRRGAAQERAA